MIIDNSEAVTPAVLDAYGVTSNCGDRPIQSERGLTPAR
jgi:hypothetical protein